MCISLAYVTPQLLIGCYALLMQCGPGARPCKLVARDFFNIDWLVKYANARPALAPATQPREGQQCDLSKNNPFPLHRTTHLDKYVFKRDASKPRGFSIAPLQVKKISALSMGNGGGYFGTGLQGSCRESRGKHPP